MDALKELDMRNWHLHDLLIYRTIQDKERDYNTLIMGKEAEAEAKGRAAGLTEGRAEGEYHKAISTARNLLENGISPEMIAKCTGLPVDEIS